MLFGLAVIVFAAAADQASKFAVDLYMRTGEITVCTDFFNLVKVWNTGVSFSLLNNYGAAGTVALSAFSLLVCAFLLNWLRKETNRLTAAALALIIGGALGNVADRVRFGAVLDFLDFHYKNAHWPAFNLADTFICIGAFLIICQEIADFNKKGLDKV